MPFLLPIYNGSKIICHTTIDVDDIDLVSGKRWHLNCNGYAYRKEGPRSASQTIFLHRVILGLPIGDREREGDHRDGDHLNNRRENLRPLTTAQNRQNLHRALWTDKPRGVSWHKKMKKWRARTQLDGKQYYLGCFDSMDEAARVAREWRQTHMPYATEVSSSLL